MIDRRFIEQSFPIREISEESSKEKSIRHGHISTLHIWWARRPLATSRSIIYASLIGMSKEEKEKTKKLDFIIKMASWENSLNNNLLNKAKAEILESNGGQPPKVLDPFAGGGSIPLEALRLGCETYASDYNPVSLLIQKCILEFPQKYGSPKKDDFGFSKSSNNQLLTDVIEWGNWIFEEVKKELSTFFPTRNDGTTPIGYTWARTIPCQNLNCKAEIPLFSSYWLVKKPKKKIIIFPVISKNKITFKILGNKKEPIPKSFDPDKGSVSRGIVTCQACETAIDKHTLKKLFADGKSSEVIVAVILAKEGEAGKTYRLATNDDVSDFNRANDYLMQKEKSLTKTIGFSAIPNEPTPDGRGSGAERGFNIRNYNMNSWGDLFNPRQKLVMITFLGQIRLVFENMLEKKIDKEYAKVVVTYLAVMLDRLADKNSNLVVYNVIAEKIEHVFGRQALPIVWDYVELNPFTNVGWPNMQNWVRRVIEHCSTIDNQQIKIAQSSATLLSYDDNFFDAVFTDPPYYDNIPYSYLSDFFYVWLKRSLGNLYPELFSTPLTPKSNEIVTYGNIEGGFEAGKNFFEKMLKKSFQEIFRVLKPNGIAVIVYAHKSTEGWETLINSLLGSGLVVTAAWPLHTERKSRLLAHGTAALSSSIYMVCRKLNKNPLESYSQVKKDLKNYLNKKLDQLWNDGIAGADFFISAIGSAIEVFGKYEKVVDDSDNVISVLKLLDDTREIVTNYAIQKVLHGEFSDQISSMTRFYILWRWAYGEAKVPFDDALKMAQSIGIDLEHEWNKGFIIKDKEIIRVIGPNERKEEDLENSHELIDVLHHILILWKSGKTEERTKLLEERGYSKSDMFKRVAQAISESLPQESTEKKWLDGFLTGFRSDDSQSGVQSKLF